MREKIIFIGISFFLLIVPYFGIREATGQKVTFYQSGDSFYYTGKQILVVPNGREIEFLEITQDDKIIKLTEIKTVGQEPSHILIKKISGINYAFSLEGAMIVQYDLSDLNNIRIANKVGPVWKNYDYYYDIASYGETKFITAGEKGITVWDASRLEYLEKIYQQKTYNIAAYHDSIYAMGKEGAVLINADREITEDPHIKVGSHQHKLYIDEVGVGYFPGDDVVKKRTYSDYKNLLHPSGAGNGIDGFVGSPYLYFVNGWDVYKLTKDLKIIKRFNSSDQEKWSVGVKALQLAQGKRIVVFNGSNILLLDENLKLLNRYFYTPVLKNLGLAEKGLKISPPHGKPGFPVMVVGTGYWPGEAINFSFANNVYHLQADNFGKVFKMTEVPDVLPGPININLEGKESKFGQSFNFKVD